MRQVITRRNRDVVLLDTAGRVILVIPNDSYRERLLKYIPVETIALFIAVYGMTCYLSGSASWYPVHGPVDHDSRHPGHGDLALED